MLSTKEETILKIGLPSYLNTLPLRSYLKASPRLKVVLLPPREINLALNRGDLDAGLASSLFYAKNFRNFYILPDLSISAVGKIKSVILYHRVSLKELDNKNLGITPETETSFGLLRIILEEFYKVFPHYKFLDKPLSEIGVNHQELEGYLAIGDEALLFDKKDYFPYSTDLAEIWLEKTQFPFVFALFILRKEVIKDKKSLVKGFLKNIYFSRAKGLSSLEKLVRLSGINLDKDFALNYLKHLEYDFSGLKQRAFLYFCELLAKKGILQEIPDLNFFSL
jgi:chorismate dehydratase